MGACGVGVLVRDMRETYLFWDWPWLGASWGVVVGLVFLAAAFLGLTFVQGLAVL